MKQYNIKVLLALAAVVVVASGILSDLPNLGIKLKQCACSFVRSPLSFARSLAHQQRRRAVAEAVAAEAHSHLPTGEQNAQTHRHTDKRAARSRTQWPSVCNTARVRPPPVWRTSAHNRRTDKRPRSAPHTHRHSLAGRWLALLGCLRLCVCVCVSPSSSSSAAAAPSSCFTQPKGNPARYCCCRATTTSTTSQQDREASRVPSHLWANHHERGNHCCAPLFRYCWCWCLCGCRADDTLAAQECTCWIALALARNAGRASAALVAPAPQRPSLSSH